MHKDRRSQRRVTTYGILPLESTSKNPRKDKNELFASWHGCDVDVMESSLLDLHMWDQEEDKNKVSWIGAYVGMLGDNKYNEVQGVRERTRALEQEAQDLDVENEQNKKLKAIYDGGTFFGNKNDDAHEHVERVLDIVSLFNILGVTHDAVMLRVFSITFIRAAKRYCPPSKTAKQLEEVRNFKQEGDETLFKAWERIIESSSNSEGIAAIVSNLESLGRDMKKLKENVHAIQVGCQTCGGAHLNKECPLNEEVKSVEEVKFSQQGKGIQGHFNSYSCGSVWA
ncbi:hypothetical protein Tco_0757419 [Tanacetum coccineum]